MTRHVAIVGARRRTDRETVDRVVAGLPADVVIVSGGAKGPDTWAEEGARKRGLATKKFHPDLAGAESQGAITRRYHARNQQIVDAADAVFALVVPDRKGGTEDTIRLRREEGNSSHDPISVSETTSLARRCAIATPPIFPNPGNQAPTLGRWTLNCPQEIANLTIASTSMAAQSTSGNVVSCF
jgi:YspA, cpYpsA-related SLOG family